MSPWKHYFDTEAISHQDICQRFCLATAWIFRKINQSTEEGINWNPDTLSSKINPNSIGKKVHRQTGKKAISSSQSH